MVIRVLEGTASGPEFSHSVLLFTLVFFCQRCINDRDLTSIFGLVPLLQARFI